MTTLTGSPLQVLMGHPLWVHFYVAGSVRGYALRSHPGLLSVDAFSVLMVVFLRIIIFFADTHSGVAPVRQCYWAEHTKTGGTRWCTALGCSFEMEQNCCFAEYQNLKLAPIWAKPWKP